MRSGGTSIRYVFDARHVEAERQDGVTRVLLGLLHATADQLGPSEELVILSRPAAEPRVTAAVKAAGARARVRSLALPIATLRQLVELPAVVERLQPDAYFYPQYDLPFVTERIPSIALIHDVTPVSYRHYFGEGHGRLRRAAATALLAQTCGRARSLLTVSDDTARRLSALFPWAASKTRPAKPGPTPLPSSTSKRHSHARFVYVGNHRPHKQVPSLLRAFGEVRRAIPSAELILVGRPDPRFPEVPALLRGPLGAGVRLEQDASDQLVSDLLHGCRALVFPSVGEGFGMPVLEAYGAGTPVIVSDAMALPEVAGEAGVVVPAGDHRALGDAMITLATDDARWATLAARTSRVLSRYSFEGMARSVLSALRDVARGTEPSQSAPPTQAA